VKAIIQISFLIKEQPVPFRQLDPIVVLAYIKYVHKITLLPEEKLLFPLSQSQPNELHPE
jgi:hypothetical protein